MTKTSARAVKAMAAWKGPISPRASAQTCARMAERPLMKDDLLKVSASHASGKPLLRCSETIQDSKPVNRMQVVMPPRSRESQRMGKLLTCSQMLMMISRTRYKMHKRLLPYLSIQMPTGPAQQAPDRKPDRKSALMFTP